MFKIIKINALEHNLVNISFVILPNCFAEISFCLNTEFVNASKSESDRRIHPITSVVVEYNAELTSKFVVVNSIRS
jgi:hypothetical protein